MCLYSSSLLLPVRGLTPTACKIYFHTDQFSFLHNQNSISDGLNGKKKKKKKKRKGCCLQSGGVLLALCAARFQLGGAERGVLHHMAVPVWQVAAG